MSKKGNCGRKRIFSSLGEKKNRTFNCYDIEFQKLRIEFEKLKRERPKYYFRKENKNETVKQLHFN